MIKTNKTASVQVFYLHVIADGVFRGLLNEHTKGTLTL